MLLNEVATGIKLEAIIEPIVSKDFKTIKKSKTSFNKFDWSRYEMQEVYKIRLKNDETILGLMCLVEHSDKATDAMEIELLEVSSENIGHEKKIGNIAGCLIAFACRESFIRGHDGFVFLTPKTSLLKHYHLKYGFEHLGTANPLRPIGIMILNDTQARKLIKEYLG